MATSRFGQLPTHGQRIGFVDGELSVPVNPFIPFVADADDDNWRTTLRVLDAAVASAFNGTRAVAWLDVSRTPHVAPATNAERRAACDAVNEFRIALVATRIDARASHRELGLFASVRAIHHLGADSASSADGDRLPVVVFCDITDDAPTEPGAQRLVEMAIRYALRYGHESITLVHDSDEALEGDTGFRAWGHHVARELFPTLTVTEDDLAKAGRFAKADALVVRARRIDAMLEELRQNAPAHTIIAAPAASRHAIGHGVATQVGPLGISSHAFLGNGIAVFEATSVDTGNEAAADDADFASTLLAGVQLFEHLGWQHAAELLTRGLDRAIAGKRVPASLAPHLSGSTAISTSAFGDAIIAAMTR